MLSRWMDHSDKTYVEIIENILNYNEWYQVDRDPISGEDLVYTVQKAFNNDQTLVINGVTITYNVLEFEYQRVRAGQENEDLIAARLSNVNGFVIIFTDGIKTQYIINKSGTDYTKTILRKLNNSNKNLSIVVGNNKIDEDMFIWMIYRVMEHPNISLSSDTDLFIEKIVGFKGHTDDRLAEIQGTGKRVFNLLSTLMFLFENESLYFVSPRVRQERDTVDLRIDLNGNIDVDIETYTGDHMLDEDLERKSKVILSVFLEIVPKILEAYYEDLNNKLWSNSVRNLFLCNIGEGIKDKIQEKIQEM